MPKNKKITSNTMSKLRDFLCADLDDVENRMALAKFVARQDRKHLQFFVDYISSQHLQSGQQIGMGSIDQMRGLLAKHKRWIRSHSYRKSWRLKSQHKHYSLLDLKSENFQSSTFHCDVFSDCRFIKSSFLQASMESCSFKNVHFVGCYFSDAEMHSCQFDNCVFEYCVIKNADFFKSVFEECLFEKTVLDWTDFALVEFKDCAGYEEAMKKAANHELSDNWIMRND